MSFRQVRGKTFKRTEDCYSCSGKGCASCNGKGAFEITYQEVWEYAYHDDGSRFEMLDDLKEIEISKVPSRKGGGCFITTATCIALNKEDQCHELMTFREYRDNWLIKNFPEQIIEYYSIAPAIVLSIDQSDCPHQIYSNIWLEYLQPCLQYIECGDYELTRIHYQQMVDSLKQLYKIK